MGKSTSSDVTGEHLVPESAPALESIGADFLSDYCGKTNGFASGSPLRHGSGYLGINGRDDLSSCVVGNYGGKVYTIYNAKNISGAYDYIIWVDAQGPSGALSGNIWLTFGDESGDHYRLKIFDSKRDWHYVQYNSDKPGIVSLNWNDEKP